MLGNINTNDTRANWANLPGRTVDISYNANLQPEKETYTDEDGNVVFAVNYTYNAYGKITKIECTEN